MASNICLILCLTVVLGQGSKSEKIGDLSSKSHGVSGAVNILDNKRIMIVGFSYDGEGPDAYFYIGTAKHSLLPNGNDGVLLPYPEGSKEPLKKFKKQNVTITMPPNVDTSDLRWLAVWCKKFSVNFGDIMFQNLMYTDDSDNNHNNNFDGDDEDYNHDPETHENKFDGKNSKIIFAPSFAVIAFATSFDLLYQKKLMLTTPI